jgi:transposase
MSSNEKADQGKVASLRNSGTLNRSARAVKDTIFQNNHFFDARDIVQVKYELLRRVQTEGVSIAEAAKNFGVSRLSYYRILAVFNECGLQGLVPQKRGPKEAHKLNVEVLKYINEQMQENPSIKISELKMTIEKKFALSLHPRTIERALVKKKKASS